MSEVNAVAASEGGHFLLLGCSDGLRAYRLSSTKPVSKLIPGPDEVLTPHGCHAVGGSVSVVALLGETPLIAFVLESGIVPDSIPISSSNKNMNSTTTTINMNSTTTSEAMPAEGVPATARVLCLYDASQRQPIAELHFPTAVLGVRANSRRLAVALEASLHILDLRSLRPLARLRTTAPLNPSGLLALSHPTSGLRGEAVSYVAFPQSDHGHGDVWVVQVTEEQHQQHQEQQEHETFNSTTVANNNNNNSRIGVVERVAIVQAHKGAVVCLAMTRDGTRLATASSRGTTVKVFEPATERLLYVFRRGITPARMLSLSFDPDSNLQDLKLAALSSRGTLHVFHCSSSGGNEIVAPAVVGVPYTGAETRSFAQVSIGKAVNNINTDSNNIITTLINVNTTTLTGEGGGGGGSSSSLLLPSTLSLRTALENRKGNGIQYCFFSDAGKYVWVVSPSPYALKNEATYLQSESENNIPLLVEKKINDTSCWILHQYAIHTNKCELVNCHVLN